MMTLLTSIVSFLIGGVPKLLDILQDRFDKDHELAMAKLQIDRDEKMATSGYGVQIKAEEVKYNELAMQGQERSMDAAYANDVESAKGASQWVINLRAVVRPAIAYGMFLLLVFVDVFGFFYAYHTGVDFRDALDELWDPDSQQIFASIISFYFGGQAFKK
jgi:hypothetical protein